MRTLLLILLLTTGAAADTVSGVSMELKRRLVEQINRDRRAAGVPAVEFSEELSRAADEHCRDMLLGDYMSHWNAAGWKPYLRYAAAGIRHATAENVWSVWQSDFDTSESQIWHNMELAHRSFMSEQPPNDGHRRAVLNPRHTHVGIGVAYNQTGLRLIELFGARYAELKPLPLRAGLKANLLLEGQVLQSHLQLFAVSIFYEPLPRPMSRSELNASGPYSLPAEERIERVALSEGRYADGTVGRIVVDRFGRFSVPFGFWKGKPGLYTAVVWVRERHEREGIMTAMTSVLVSDE
jgi:uncharacterized protein YkwD